MGVGLARVTISFDDWKAGHVARSQHQMAVVRPKRRVVLEEVSPRLKAELIHPDREASLAGMRFSPDGRQIIAGSYPEGVIQLWEVESGRQLTKIDSGYGYRGTDDFCLISPDWSRIYVSRESRTHNKLEREGKKLNRWEFEGEIREWDLATGEVTREFRQSPTRGIAWATLSPDGRTIMVGEELPGESEGGPRPSVSLLDVATGKFRELHGRLAVVGAFSPDSRTLAVSQFDDDDWHTVAIKFFDVATGGPSRSIPIREPFSDLGREAFSPDGRLLVVPQFVESGARPHGNGSLRFFTADSDTPVASLPLGEKDANYGGVMFSPDGRMLAAVTWRGTSGRLFLFDVTRRALAHTVILGEDNPITRDPVFSPDGRWVAVATQAVPEELRRDIDMRAEDVPQPRIHLVDAATGEIRETIISPQGFTSSGCFSPDGKTLATAGTGRVLLWDLSTPPGELRE